MSQCPACEATSRRVLFSVREHEYETTTMAFPLVECLECGAWYLDPRPDEAALGVIYPPNYYIYVLEDRSKGDIATARKGAFSSLAGWLFKKRIKPIERHLPITAATTWFDVGCGNGSVLESMREAYGAKGTGIDLSATAVEFCRRRGFEARVGRFEDYVPAPGEAYDLVHSSHVIEHLASPLDYMRKVRDLLRPGGISVFITPNTGTWEARRLGRHWGGLHAPRHWTLLNPRSARLLVERAGLEHLETCFSTNGTFWTWSFHSLARPYLGRLGDRIFPSDHRFIESNLWNIVRIGGFTMFDLANVLLLGQSSNMMVIARRPE